MSKAEHVTWLQDEYQHWAALLDQIDPERMELPGVAGYWSIKDIVAHLNEWQRRNIARIQAAQRGEPEPPPPWPPHLHTDDEVNAWIYQANHGRPVRDVLNESAQVFDQTLAVAEGLPDDILIEPTYHSFELRGERFSAGEVFYHFREDHESGIHAWLARVEAPSGAEEGFAPPAPPR